MAEPKILKDLKSLKTHSESDEYHNVPVKRIKSDKDSNGVFKTVEHVRKSNGKLLSKSTLSGGESPQYTSRTVTYYDDDGVTVTNSFVYTLTYDADGDLISEV